MKLKNILIVVDNIEESIHFLSLVHIYAKGYKMVKEIIRVAVEDGVGYTDYVFPKEGETKPSPKRSYSEYFEPFDWVVGTGNYTCLLYTSQVKIKGFGKVGYVANSPYTVKGESMSAGRLYDKIGGKAKGKIVFVLSLIHI